MSELVRFEFFYDYGHRHAFFHHGSLPRDEFERLVRGEGPHLIRIQDVAYWKSDDGAFFASRPAGSEPEGAAYFRRDRMSRIWPVSSASVSVREPQEERQPPPRLQRVLEEFFGAPLDSPRIIKETLLESDLPNLEMAVEDFVRREASSHELHGVAANDQFTYHPGLRRILMPAPRGQEEFFTIRAGPPEWKRLPIEPGKYRDCLALGVHLVNSRSGKLAIAIWPDKLMRSGGNTLEVMALDEDLARTVLDDLREGMARLSIYRGRVIELRPVQDGCGYQVAFAHLKIPAREDIVLPDGLLEIIERNALAPLRHRGVLLGAGRHLRRGLLLHGKPGTGKTLTARYLAGQLEGYTVILLTGPSLGLLPQACRLGRALSPSAVILEDVDLIAREREENKHASLLHNLLDEMDGLGPKVEMVFILTTNRPDILEPALASRPGRIDQAIEFPLPDQAARQKLFALYARGISVAADLGAFVERTQGASGAFIEELLRRALVFAAEEASPEVRDVHMDKALRELVFAGGELTRSLLGFGSDQG